MTGVWGLVTLAVNLTAVTDEPLRESRQRVALVQAHQEDPVLLEAGRRIAAELVVSGAQVSWIAGEGDVSPKGLASLARVEGVDIVIALHRVAPDAAVDMRLHDDLHATQVSRTVSREAGSDDAGVVAVRVVEMWRAHQLAHQYRAAARPEPQTAVVTKARVAQASSGERNTFTTVRVELGATTATDWPVVHTAFAPLVSVFLSRGRFGGRLVASGLGTPVSVSETAGRVDVRRESVELQGVWRTPGRFEPQLSLSAGLAHYRLDGTAEAPFVTRDGALWTPIIGVGGGFTWQIGQRISLTCDVRARLRGESPVVRVAGVETMRLGNPELAVTVGLAFDIGAHP